MKNRIIVMVLLVIVFILTALLGFGFFMYQNELFPFQAKKNQAHTLKEQSINGIYTASIEDLILNITSSKGAVKYVKFSFTLQSEMSGFEELIEENRAEIIDNVIFEISQRTSEELLSIGGKVLLKEDLLETLNRHLLHSLDQQNIPPIEKILFTHFVMK
jgi:flagellar protein FliL